MTAFANENFLFPAVAEEQARQSEEARERRLANLIPFKPGQSGNPDGRRTGGAYMEEFLNMFLRVRENGLPRFTRTDLISVISDPTMAPAAIAAATEVLLMMSSGQKFVRDKKGAVYPAGFDPEPGRARDRVLDRLIGKAKQTVDITHHADRSREEIIQELAVLVQSNPEILEQLQRLPLPEREIVATILPDATEEDFTTEPPEVGGDTEDTERG